MKRAIARKFASLHDNLLLRFLSETFAFAGEKDKIVLFRRSGKIFAEYS